MKIHHPPHIYLDNTYYFITARVYEGKRIFNTDQKKRILLNTIRVELHKNKYILMAWVILENHYHILFKTKLAFNLSRIMNRIHGLVSYRVNKIEKLQGRKIFQNYWDRCIRNEKDYYTHLNYIHHNPVKHGYVQKMSDYEFSSYNYWLKTKGLAWMRDCFSQCPVITSKGDYNIF